MNAVNCTKPGYTRRLAPGKPAGTVLIRIFSNQAIAAAQTEKDEVSELEVEF